MKTFFSFFSSFSIWDDKKAVAVVCCLVVCLFVCWLVVVVVVVAAALVFVATGPENCLAQRAINSK